MLMDDIRRIDLNLLAALDAMLDAGSVTRAAERLALAQPTVSGMLRRLRALLGDALFVRGQHGIRPTPRALALAPALKRLLADAEALVAAPRFDPATASQTFTISTTDHMQQGVVVPLLAALRRTAPGVRIAVRPLAIADLPAQLARGEADLAITIPEFAAPDLVSRRLYVERYVAAVRPGHPIGRRAPSLAAFCRFDHVVVSPAGGGFWGPVDDALAAAGRTRRVAVSLPTFLTVPSLLRASDLIAVVPERVALGHGVALRTFPVPVALPRIDVIAVWHARTNRDPGHRWLRELLAACSGPKPMRQR
jgi:DNA-binding transcriptional LysR family regulator